MRFAQRDLKVAFGFFSAILVLGIILNATTDYLDQMAAFIWDIFNNVKDGILGETVKLWSTPLITASTVLTSMATSLYLLATWRLLVHTRRAHDESQKLTLKLHADSLTPALCLEEFQNNLFVTSSRNPTLRVRSAMPSDTNENIMIINSGVEVQLSELLIAGSIDFVIKNASNNVAEASIKVLGNLGNFEQLSIISPHRNQEYHFDINTPVSDSRLVTSLLSANESVKMLVSGKGPGGSARDGFHAVCPIGPQLNDTENIDLTLHKWHYQKRYRKYNEESENDD